MMKHLADQRSGSKVILATVFTEPHSLHNAAWCAWCEAFDFSVPSAAELAQMQRDFDDEMQPVRDGYVRQLVEGNARHLDAIAPGISTPRLVMHFRRADFAGSKKLKRQRLSDIDFQEANFSGCNLYLSDLRDCDLRGARLDDARIQGVNLNGAKLCQASLVGSDLQQAYLSHTDLSGADCRNAVFTEARFERTNLQGADLRGATLDSKQLKHANIDGSTRLPKRKTRTEATSRKSKTSRSKIDGKRAATWKSEIPPVPDASDREGVKDYIDACMRYFDALQTEAQERWINGKDPRAKLVAACESAKSTRRFLNKVNWKGDAALGQAVLIGYLLNSRFDREMMKWLPSIGKWKNSDRFIELADAGLCQMMANERKPNGWDAMIEHAVQRCSPKTFFRSFQHYTSLLRCMKKGDVDAALQHIDAAEKDFGRWSQGETFYWDVVDFRLAAVMKFAFRRHKKAHERIESSHTWNW